MVLAGVLLICGLQASGPKASQEEEAAALVELFAEEGTFERGRQLDLRIDGCSAKLDNGWRHFRFLLSSVDFEVSANPKWNDGISLNEDAFRQTRIWMQRWGPLPHPPGLVIFGEVSKDEQREAKFRFARENIEYFERMLRGEFGPWFAEHHEYEVEDGAPQGFRPTAGTNFNFRTERKQAVIAAIASYTRRYCLPAPDYSCTKFFVNELATSCTERDRATE